ncbi:hypothetical protein CBM2626_B60088 [Cupriavidus taiwanensis]|nr:hypothetical protein CBM2626_B60088 [Cupriavidus taiwanensis]
MKISADTVIAMKGNFFISNSALIMIRT